MVKLKVSIKATLEGVTNLRPASNDFVWTFKIKCLSCHEEHPNWIGIDATSKRPMSGSRGEANFVWRCSLCKREASIDVDDQVLKRDKAALTLEESEVHKFAPLIVFECRGCEILSFDPKGNWVCEGAESKMPFECELSLDEPDGWSDYDEKANQPVSIMEFESRIDRA